MRKKVLQVPMAQPKTLSQFEVVCLWSLGLFLALKSIPGNSGVPVCWLEVRAKVINLCHLPGVDNI